jgi:hypothetical protein
VAGWQAEVVVKMGSNKKSYHFQCMCAGRNTLTNEDYETECRKIPSRSLVD